MNPFGPQQGWQCPACHVVHAPFIPSCSCALQTGTTQTGVTWTQSTLSPTNNQPPPAACPLRTCGQHDLDAQRQAQQAGWGLCYGYLNGCRCKRCNERDHARPYTRDVTGRLKL